MTPSTETEPRTTMNHVDVCKANDNKKNEDDDLWKYCVIPNPHTMNDERSGPGLSLRPGGQEGSEEITINVLKYST